MPEVAESPERAQLRDLEFQLEDVKDRLVDELNRVGDTPTVDAEFLKRFKETAHRLARQVNSSLPLSFPAEASDEIRRTMIDTLTEADEIAEARPLDALDGLLIRLEQIRHIIRDALDESLGVKDDDGRGVAERLTVWLDGVRQRDIADLVGVSPRTLQRLLKDGGTPPNRMRLAARLVVILRRAWTPAGVMAWFRRPRMELDNRAPIDVLDDPEYEERLMSAARQGRAQHGS